MGIGVSQGSILSPAVFHIKINNIVKSVVKCTDSSLFVDDFALCAQGKSLCTVERAMQFCVNNVLTRIQEMLSNFQIQNYFCQQVEPLPDPEILLYRTPIKVVTEAQFF